MRNASSSGCTVSFNICTSIGMHLFQLPQECTVNTSMQYVQYFSEEVVVEERV